MFNGAASTSLVVLFFSTRNLGNNAMFNTRLTAAEIDAIEQYQIENIQAVLVHNEECERIAKQNADLLEWEDNG